MIIFTEPQFVSRVMEERSRRGLLDKTMVYPMLYEMSRFWPCMDRIYELYGKQQVPQGFCPKKDSALYVWNTANKFDCLERAIRMNPWVCKKKRDLLI